MLNSINLTILLAVIFLFLGFMLGLISYRAINSLSHRQRYLRMENELLRVLKHVNSSKIYVEFHGKIYHAVEQMQLDHYRELLRLMNSLSKWVGAISFTEQKYISQNQQTESTSYEIPGGNFAPVDDMKVDQIPKSDIADGTIDRSKTALEQDAGNNVRDAEQVSTKKTGSFIQSFMKSLRAENTIAAAQEISLVEQIDAILQKKIANSPYEDADISIKAGPDHELIFAIDERQYTSIEAVPNEHLRKLIKDSVAEWEKQQDAYIN